MNVTMVIFLMVLFFVLAPGQFVTFPSTTAPKMNVNLTHAVLFALVWHLTHEMVEKSALQVNI
jgi:hypothetical protein